MARRNNMSEVQAANTRDIGYLDGKLSSLESRLEEAKLDLKSHRAESKKIAEEQDEKLDQIIHTMSMWRFGMWLVKGLGASAAALLSWKGLGSLIDIWK